MGFRFRRCKSFSGIYPKSNPQVIIYASVKKPSGGSQKPVSNAVKEIVGNNFDNIYFCGTEEEWKSMGFSIYYNVICN